MTSGLFRQPSRWHRPSVARGGGRPRTPRVPGEYDINDRRDIVAELSAIEQRVLAAYGTSIQEVGQQVIERIVSALQGDVGILSRRNARSRVHLRPSGPERFAVAVNADDVPADWVISRTEAFGQRARRPRVRIRAHYRRRGKLALAHGDVAEQFRLPGHPFPTGGEDEPQNQTVFVRSHIRRAVSGPVVYQVGQQRPTKQWHTFYSPRLRALRRELNPSFTSAFTPTRVWVPIRDEVQRIMNTEIRYLVEREYPEAFAARLRGPGGPARIHRTRLHDIRTHSRNPYLRAAGRT